MSVYARTQGIVLKKRDRGEYDRVISVFTRDFGKLELWATSERKITSKLRAGLEPLCFSEIEFVEGKRKKIITNTKLIEGHWNIRKSLAALWAALLVAKFAARMLVEPERDERVWNLLRGTLEGLNQGKEDPHTVNKRFRLHFLSFLGYKGKV